MGRSEITRKVSNMNDDKRQAKEADALCWEQGQQEDHSQSIKAEPG